MRLFLLFILPVLWFTPPIAPTVRSGVISCPPPEAAVYIDDANIRAVKDGNWNDPATWGGRVPGINDIAGIPVNIKVTYNASATVKGIRNMGQFLWAPGVSVELKSSENIVNEGYWEMKPNSYLVKQVITFTGINESNTVGSNMNVNPRDVGFWTMGSGKTYIQGERKTTWTSARGSITKGSNKISVNESVNWRVGDQIVINPTDETPQNQTNFENLTPIDPYGAKYEVRTITAISNGDIIVDKPWLFNHLIVDNKWTAKVMNLSRNITIQGTTTGRAHMFTRSTVPQFHSYFALKHMGPRFKITGDRERGDGKNGLYADHFHHNMDGSIGTIIEGLALSEIGTRGIVPHVSNGITVRDVVIYKIAQDGFWWDRNDEAGNGVSNEISYTHNALMWQYYAGTDDNVTGFTLGLGDDNKCNDNFVSRGDKKIMGAGSDFEWVADNDSPWEFERNESATGHMGIKFWQNSPWIHRIFRYVAYNMYMGKEEYSGGVWHGAYTNNVVYRECSFFNAGVKIQATATANIGPKFIDCYFNGDNKIDYVIQVHGSAIPGNIPNIVINSRLSNWRIKPVQILSPFVEDENERKIGGFVNNTYNDKNKISVRDLANYHAKNHKPYRSEAWIQSPDNTAEKLDVDGNVTAIPVFHPTRIDNGTGLLEEIYSGVSFNKKIVERLALSVRMPQVSVDFKSAASGLHWKLGYNKANKVVNPFSIRWTGWLIPQYTGVHKFRLRGAQAKRLSINGQQLINNWQDVGDEDHTVESGTINLTAGQRYPILVETFNQAPPYTFYLEWSNQNQGWAFIEPSQLFPKEPTGPEIPINRPPVVGGGGDQVIQLPDSSLVIKASATDPDDNIVLFKWTGPPAVKIQQNLSDARHAFITSSTIGKHTLIFTATDGKGLSASASITLLVLPKKPDTTGPVNPCTIFDPVYYLKKYPDVAKHGTYGKDPLRHYNEYGKREGRLINAACEGSFKNAARVDSVTCLSGEVITARVETGKYTSTSQALADALAIQDINTQLSKCPLPWFTAPYKDKTLYIFGTELNPIIKIK